MTQPQTVLPGGAPPPAAAPPARLTRSQQVAAALVAVFVVSGAVVLFTRDAPVAPPPPVTETHATLVAKAGAACAVVKGKGYAWPQVGDAAQALHRLVPPAADAAGWTKALQLLDVSVTLEQKAYASRADKAAVAALAAPRKKSQSDAKAAFAALGVTACPGA